MLALNYFESADSRADEHAHTFGVLCRHLQARLLHRLLGCAKGVVDEAPHLARFLLVQEFERIEILDLGSKGDRESRSVKTLDRRNATGAGQQLPPQLG